MSAFNILIIFSSLTNEPKQTQNNNLTKSFIKDKIKVNVFLKKLQ